MSSLKAQNKAAYSHFNASLFASQLPDCLITLQRKANAYGYFQGRKFREHKGDATTDEIALNPAHFEERSAKEILSTLAHELVHLWQQHHGTPGRRGCHNPEWAAKMNQIGLIDSKPQRTTGRETNRPENDPLDQRRRSLRDRVRRVHGRPRHHDL